MTVTWTVYLLELSDGRFYVGLTSRLSDRVAEHASGRGPTATRTHLPVRLLWKQELPDLETARRVERWLKRRSREEKQKYCSENGEWVATSA